MEQWAYGSMAPKGSRLPTGGAAGDGYREYPSMSTGDVSGIQMIFSHAIVSFYPTLPTPIIFLHSLL